MKINDELEWMKISWLPAFPTKEDRSNHSIMEPPQNGLVHAFVFRLGDKALILCPYTLKSVTVDSDSWELSHAVNPLGFCLDRFQGVLIERLERFSGKDRDLDTTNKILKILQGEVTEVSDDNDDSWLY